MAQNEPKNGQTASCKDAAVNDCTMDSNCSTPYASAPSSPGRKSNLYSFRTAFFFSAPSSPVHDSADLNSPSDSPSSGGDFDFSSRFPFMDGPGVMSTAEELFFNGQIRPMRLASHFQRQQTLHPLLDHDAEDTENVDGEGNRHRDTVLRSRSVHRKSRSLSPFRSPLFQWRNPVQDTKRQNGTIADADPPFPATASRSSSSSSTSSSSSSKSSKRWVFVKDFLRRNRNEGSTANLKDAKFWPSFSVSKPPPGPIPESAPPTRTSKLPSKSTVAATTTAPAGSGGGGISTIKRATSKSAHERFYAANRAHAEEMRRRTFLPYRQGLLGCLGFSSRSYGAINGFARGFTAAYSTTR